ncbi:MAG: restriction endonuclease subunit S [Alphaproteobacteria bacterium]|nr:restriction endonuclease subunit S [Alphaproteobacteria bacterium]
MSEWQKTTLGELCEESGGDIQTGPFGSQLHAADYVPVGVPSIMPQNIGDNRISTDGIARINSDDAKRLSRYLVKEGDIVYSRRGDVERRALIRKEQNGWLCGTGCLRVRFGSKKPIDPTFMSHYLGDPIIRAWIVQHAVGATMPNLNTSILSNVPVLLPSYNEQKAIAAILGALDDKIELNRRMNATLEAMARALFKSWFVDFDPVRAKMEGKQPFGMDSETAALFPSRLVSSELGDIPEGWDVGAVTDIVELNPSTAIQKDTTAPYLDMAALPVVGSWPDAPSQRAVSSGSRFKNGDTLLARITPCLENGKTAFVSCLPDDVVGWGSTEFIILRPRPPVPSEYGYILARFDSFRSHAIQSMTGTSGRQRVQVESLGRYQLPIPDKNIFIEFGKQVAPLFEKIQCNAKENEDLSNTRDYLLPKLISGDIRIPDAEKFVEAA